MATESDYDGEIQMFVQRPRELDLAHLRFLRWLAVRGYLEHAPAGRSYGAYARDAGVLAQADAVALGTAPAHAERAE